MKNKGFTLIEVMATVLIIAAIALLSFPVLTNVVQRDKEIDEKTFKENAILAAKTYCNLSNEEECSVTVEQLIKESYLDKPNNSKINYKSLSINCDKGICKYKSTAVGELLVKVNPVNVTTYQAGSYASHEMYTFEHPATEQTGALTDYRYIGFDPYNYAKFNCDDNGDNCEIWRIVGIFTVENENGSLEQRIKLIRNDKLENDMAWHSTENYMVNWEASSLNNYLNGEYYNYNLSNSAKSLIEPAKIYLGIGGKSNFDEAQYYEKERSNNTYNNRQLNDLNNVTLLYTSDYYYTFANGVGNGCYNSVIECKQMGTPTLSWLYHSNIWWLVSTFGSGSGYASSIFRVASGFISDAYLYTRYSCGVIPSVYLSAGVELDGEHTGSSTDPYVFKKG